MEQARMASLVEIREELNTKRKELHEVWQQAGPERDFDKVTLLGQGDTEQKLAEMRRRSQVIDDLADQEQKLAHVETLAIQNEREMKRLSDPVTSMVHGGGTGAEDRPFKAGDLRKALNEHKQYKAFRDGSARSFTIELPNVNFKTLIDLSYMTPQAVRMPPRDLGIETRTVGDLMLQGSIDRTQLDYFEETSLTNNAATVAEAGLKPESASGMTLRTENVRKIATWIPATKESLDDIPALESWIRGRLSYMVERVKEAQILTGNGVAPNLLGFLNRGIQTHATGADPAPDAIYKGMQMVRGAAGDGFSEPTAIVMHPLNYTAVRLMRTVDGVYIWGNPSDEGPDRMWGLPVRQTTAMTQNTALVGAFRPESELFEREGISITVATEDGSDFLYNRVKIMAEMRVLMAVYRPLAFASVTGLPAETL